MKKLLIINVACNTGSTGRIAEQIGQIAIQSGYDVYFAHGPRYVANSKLKTFQIGHKLGNIIHFALYDKVLGLDGLGSSFATKKLIDKIKEIKPDIIHLHNIHGYYLNFKLLFEYLNTTDIKIVWTLHDCWVLTGGCTFLNHSRCDKWKDECFHCPIKGDFPKHSLIDNSKSMHNLKKRLLTANSNITFVPVSNWVGNLMKESFLSTADIQVIHNGVDLSVFTPMNQANSSSKFTVIGVASPWCARKGLNDFIKLSIILGKEYQIILVGVNDEQLNKLPFGIVGIKRTSNSHELADLYSKADVFVNPTYSDNFPTTNIEALACGTPVITYKTGGSPEAIDEKTGIVIKQGDVDDLADAIRNLKDNLLLSSDCRKRAEAMFDKNICFKQYLSIFDSVTI